MKTNLLLIAFGAFCIFAALGFPAGGGAVSEAAVCPIAAASAIIIFALADIAALLRGARAGGGEEPPAQAGGGAMFAKLAAASAVYAAVMPWLGFIVSTSIFCAATLWIFGYKNKLRSLGFGCAFALILYFVFAVAMKVALPAGILN